jgi:hypothetical protein
MIDRGDRKVIRSEGADFAHANACLYFEASGETGAGVEAPLLTMMRELLYIDGRRLTLGRRDSR